MKGQCKFLKNGKCTVYIDDPYGEECIGYEKCDAYEESED